MKSKFLKELKDWNENAKTPKTDKKTCNPEFFIKCDFHDSLRGAETHDFAK